MPDATLDLLASYLQDKNADGYIFSGPINNSTADEVIRVIDTHSPRRPDACFFLTTFGGDLTVGIFSPITAQIDPLRLGVLWRSNEIGFWYGQRIASANVKPEAIRSLVYGYPAHGFVIDEEEARQLFQSVRHFEGAEEAIFSGLQPIFRVPRNAEHAIVLGLPLDSVNPADASGNENPESNHIGKGENNETGS